jgi:hypothetical protein
LFSIPLLCSDKIERFTFSVLISTASKTSLTSSSVTSCPSTFVHFVPPQSPEFILPPPAPPRPPRWRPPARACPAGPQWRGSR